MSCGWVAQIRAEKPCSAEGSVLEQAGDDEALRLTLERGQWHVEFHGEFGEGVLVLGVNQEPGEQRCLVLGPKDGPRRWHGDGVQGTCDPTSPHPAWPARTSTSP